MLPGEVSFALAIHSCQVDCAFSLDIANYLRNSVFWRNGYQHMNVVWHQMPLYNLALLLSCQFVEHFAKMLTQLLIQHFSAAFWDEYHMIFVFPF